MPSGLERRDLTQDPLASVQPQAGAVPLNPVKSPNPSSFKDVGEDGRILAKLLGDASSTVGKYYERRAAESDIEGRMAFYSGKTQQEIAASGNMYTMQGFMAVKTATAAEELKTNSFEELETSDYQLTPEAYRAKQMQRFNALLSEMGDDPTVKEVLTNQAEHIMPALAAHHAKLHNDWKMKETEDSEFGFIDSIANGVDPQEVKKERLRERSAKGTTGIPEDKEAALKANASIYQLEVKKNKTYPEALITRPATLEGLIANPPTQFLALLRNKESNNNYNVANGSREIPFTSMTIKEVLAWQEEDAKTNGKASHAAGAYQFMKGTLQDAVKDLGLTGDELFDEAMQDKLAISRLHYRGITKGLTDAELLTNLSQEWASLKGPTGAGAYDGKAGNMATVEPAQVLAALRGGVTQAALADSLLHDHGVDPATVMRVTRAYAALDKEQQDSFNVQRITHEKAVLDSAQQSADLPAALIQIQQMKDTYGYSDSWAEALAGRAMSAVEAAERVAAKDDSIRTSLSTNSLGTRSADEQRRAFDLIRMDAAKAFETDPTVTERSDTARAQYIDNRVINAAVNNNVVDTVTRDTIATQLSGQIFDKNGVITPQALGAYTRVRELIKQGGEVYASQYFGKASEIINTALEFDDGNMDAASALLTAQEILTQKRSGTYKEPTFNPAVIHEAVNDLIDSSDPSWLYYMSTKHAVAGSLFRDTEFEKYHKAFRKDPENIERLSGIIKGYAVKHAVKGIPEKTAARMAMQEAARRTELVGGGLLISGPASTIREDAGLANMDSVNGMEDAMFDYIKTVGPTEWGDEWKVDRTWWGRIVGGNDNEARLRNLIASQFYDYNRKTWNVTLWADENRTRTTAPRAIPIQKIGELYMKPESMAKRNAIGVRKQATALAKATTNWLETDGKDFVDRMNLSGYYIGN